MRHVMISKGDHTRAAKAGNSLSQLAAAQLSLLTSPNSATAPPRAQAKPSLNKATASVLKAGILVGAHMRLGQGHAAEAARKQTRATDPVFISALEICAIQQHRSALSQNHEKSATTLARGTASVGGGAPLLWLIWFKPVMVLSRTAAPVSSQHKTC